jgi:hypothetical protein
MNASNDFHPKDFVNSVVPSLSAEESDYSGERTYQRAEARFVGDRILFGEQEEEIRMECLDR